MTDFRGFAWSSFAKICPPKAEYVPLYLFFERKVCPPLFFFLPNKNTMGSVCDFSGCNRLQSLLVKKWGVEWFETPLCLNSVPWFATRFRLPFDAGAPFLGGCEPEVLRGAGALEQRFPLSNESL